MRITREEARTQARTNHQVFCSDYLPSLLGSHRGQWVVLRDSAVVELLPGHETPPAYGQLRRSCPEDARGDRDLRCLPLTGPATNGFLVNGSRSSKWNSSGRSRWATVPAAGAVRGVASPRIDRLTGDPQDQPRRTMFVGVRDTAWILGD